MSLLIQHHSFILLSFSASYLWLIGNMVWLVLSCPASLSHLKPLQPSLHVCFILPFLQRALLRLLMHKGQVKLPPLPIPTFSPFKLPHPRMQTLICEEIDAYCPKLGQASTSSPRSVHGCVTWECKMATGLHHCRAILNPSSHHLSPLGPV